METDTALPGTPAVAAAVPAVLVETARSPIMTPDKAIAVLLLYVGLMTYGSHVLGDSAAGGAFEGVANILLALLYLRDSESDA